jgi:tRNA threonylcarbamoyladenosine biosynthesis protein TsaB
MSPLILAVDTTHDCGSIALARGETLLEEMPLHASTGFAQILYGCISELLGRHAVALAEIDLFATASGPGSFTGVRVGMACVKGLAEARAKPAVAVSNLDVLAHFGKRPLRAPLLDARRGDVYGAVYDAAARIVVPEMVAKLPVWLASLPPGIEFVSNDFTAFGDALSDGPRVTAPRELAAMVARIAATREPQDPAALDANYVRRSDAEMAWKDERAAGNS